MTSPSFLEFLSTSWDHVLELAIGHALVVAISLAIAVVLGVSLGVLVYRRERAANVALAITSTFLTIPSLALFGLLIPLPLVGGLGYKPAVVALVMYALLPILRNTVTGLRSVDPAIAESAQGMGMSARERLFRIELPLAWPVIIAGVRVSTMLLMGIAAIAAVVNGPGLGEDIFAGLARIGGANALNLVLSGTLGIIVLALIFDTFFNLLGKLTTSRGIRD
ncbi:MAG: ABC transporter permease [Actinomycetota bacterium]|nr:ABC transporter permease [Actinomycetota bacterium]MDQ5817314.1 ABC transporter permease [Actinomycetota bacterium]